MNLRTNDLKRWSRGLSYIESSMAKMYAITKALEDTGRIFVDFVFNFVLRNYVTACLVFVKH